MHIDLGERWETFIREQIKRGRFASASEAVCEALHLLQEREEHRRTEKEALRAEVDKGLHALDHGECIELDAQGMRDYLKNVDARGRERLARNKPA